MLGAIATESDVDSTVSAGLGRVEVGRCASLSDDNSCPEAALWARSAIPGSRDRCSLISTCPRDQCSSYGQSSDQRRHGRIVVPGQILQVLGHSKDHVEEVELCSFDGELAVDHACYIAVDTAVDHAAQDVELFMLTQGPYHDQRTYYYRRSYRGSKASCLSPLPEWYCMSHGWT